MTQLCPFVQLAPGRPLPAFPSSECMSDVEPDTREMVRAQNKKKKKSGGFQSMGRWSGLQAWGQGSRDGHRHCRNEGEDRNYWEWAGMAGVAGTDRWTHRQELRAHPQRVCLPLSIPNCPVSP